MTKPIQQLRGESGFQLVDALGATPQDIQDLEQGSASPAVERLRLLTEHVGMRDNGIGLEPEHEPSFGERSGDALTL